MNLIYVFEPIISWETCESDGFFVKSSVCMNTDESRSIFVFLLAPASLVLKDCWPWFKCDMIIDKRLIDISEVSPGI